MKPKPRPAAGDLVSGSAPSSSAKLRENSSPRKDAATLPPPVITQRGDPVVQIPVAGASVAVSNRSPYKMRPGDPVVIFLRDLPGTTKEQTIEDILDDTGTINLPFIGRMSASGKTTSVFEQEIENEYINVKKIYLHITVNVVIPQQFVFVMGEVKLPNQYRLVSGMTLMQAITSAGGFNDYADRKKVQLIRGGAPKEYNALELDKHPENDIPVEAGDRIVVPRSIW
jgi:polysaccharide export outer membrane protein